MSRDPRDAGHEVFDELAVGWALHALEPEDETSFAGHLARCDRCARTVSETHEVMAAMATDLPVAEPGEGLRERLRAAVEQTEQVPGPPAARPTEVPGMTEVPTGQVAGVDAPVGRRRPAPPDGPGGAPTGFPGPRRRHAAGRSAWRRVAPNALVSAAVAAILALGTWNVVVTGDRDAARATAAAQAEVMDALLVPGQATIAPMEHDGHTVATVVARDGQAQVITDGMTVNDVSTSTYVLWGMTAGGPVPLGTFDVVATGMDLRTVGSDATGLNSYTAYGISIEPGRRAPSSPTDIVANGQVTS